MRQYVTVVFDRDTSRVLVDELDGSFRLPRLPSRETPSKGYKMTESFREELEDFVDTSFDLVFLYSTVNETFQRHIPPMPIAIFESRKPVNPNPEYEGFMWQDVRDMGPERFASWFDAQALPYIRRIDEECSEKGVRPWKKPGWLQTTTEEATAILRRLGYEVLSAFQQFSITSNSAILTVRTNEGLIYLKASNRHEGKITECISSIDPRLARKPLYVDTERGWMFMEDCGQSLEDKMTRTDLENLKDLLGGLQRKAESQVQRLIDGGVPRVDPENFLMRIEKMLEDIFLSGDRENVLRRAPEEVERFDENAIRRHRLSVRALLKHLYEDQKIPLTIVHGDINDFNITKYGVEKDSYAFIDWQEASIDLPLTSVEDLLTEIVSVEGKAEASTDSYLQHWSEYGSLQELKELRKCLDLKGGLNGFLEFCDYAVAKGLRAYLEERKVNRLCELLHEVAEAVNKLEQR